MRVRDVGKVLVGLAVVVAAIVVPVGAASAGAALIDTDTGSASFVAGDNASSTPVVIDAGVAIWNSATGTISGATVAITGNYYAGEDVLQFVNDGSTMGNITASYDAGMGVLTLTSAGSTATVAQLQSALRSVTYNNAAVKPETATRTVSFWFEGSDGNKSNTASRTVTVTATDQTPIVTTSGATLNYTLGSPASVVDSGVTVDDLDNSTQASAVVAISAGFGVGDVLAFVNDGSTMGNITASYNAATGVLTLTSAGATATNAQWASALSSVTFSSTGSMGNRTISFVVHDGTKTSSAAVSTVVVKQVVVPPATPPTYRGVARVAGPDRISTSIAASQRQFPGAAGTANAKAVVLVGASDAIDGLTGAPLAAAVNAPLLYIGTTSVPANVLAEIQRVLAPSGKVYLLGGAAAIGNSVEAQLHALGYTTQRVAGADRYSTAAAIADEIARAHGMPSAVFEVTGLDHADALVAAPAAAGAAGVVLLTVGPEQAAATTAWLKAHPGVTRYAVGGPAAAADRSATAVSGADRFATAVAVAKQFFPSASAVALANGMAWPDAAVAAVKSALDEAPLLLVTADGLPAGVTAWLGASSLVSVTAYGGTTRISDGVHNSVATITGLPLR